MSEERRRHPRVPLEGDLEIGLDEEDVVWVRGRDVSLRGLSFYSAVPFEDGTPIGIGVQSEQGGAFVVDGVVRRCEPEGERYVIGVEFPEDLSDAHFDLLRKPPH